VSYVLQLVVDVVAFDSPDIIDKLFLKKLRNNEMDAKDPGCGRRFVLPLPREKPVSRKWTFSYIQGENVPLQCTTPYHC
jgi:hypothetical protein